METETRIKALAKHLEIDAEDIEEAKYGNNTFEVGGGKYPAEYLVLADDEADDVWDERLESYIEECILGDLPKHLRMYFDSDSWKEDARSDGRGHSISSYDGSEEEIEIEGETLYIYRIN